MELFVSVDKWKKFGRVSISLSLKTYDEYICPFLVEHSQNSGLGFQSCTGLSLEIRVFVGELIPQKSGDSSFIRIK